MNDQDWDGSGGRDPLMAGIPDKKQHEALRIALTDAVRLFVAAADFYVVEAIERGQPAPPLRFQGLPHHRLGPLLRHAALALDEALARLGRLPVEWEEDTGSTHLSAGHALIEETAVGIFERWGFRPVKEKAGRPGWRPTRYIPPEDFPFGPYRVTREELAFLDAGAKLMVTDRVVPAQPIGATAPPEEYGPVRLWSDGTASIRRRTVKPLTKTQANVIRALIRAEAAGLKLDELRGVAPGAWKILQTLDRRKEWSGVIHWPGDNHDGYRINPE